MMGTVFLLALRGVFSRMFKSVHKGLSAILRWSLADWRNGPLLIGWLVVAAHIFAIDPSLRKTITKAQGQLATAKDDLADEQAAHAQSIANIRAASEQALADAMDNAERVAAEQRVINQEEVHAFQTRIAAARDRYDRLVSLRRAVSPAVIPAGAGRADAADLSGPGTNSARADQTPGDYRLPDPGRGAELITVCLKPEQALIATEQALQLDALISWVLRQSRIEQSFPEAGNAGQ